MKPFVHQSLAGAALLMLGACSTYMPLDGGSTVPWAKSGSAPVQLAAGPASADRSRIGVQAVTVEEVPTVDLRGRVHRIERGETLVSIARRYRVSVGELVAANRLERPYVIYAGEVLRVPAGAEVRPVSARAEQHVVRRGESLTVIARRYGVSVSALARQNDLRSPDALRVGQRLDVPADSVVRTAAAPAEEGFLWPVQGKVVTGFGPKPDGEISHGIAIAARKGTPVRAAKAGEVIYAGEAIRGYGRMVLVRHDDDYVTTYAHNQTLLVKVGDPVQRGQVIARVGDTGEVDRAQLHFELRKGRKPLDPEAHLVEPVTELASSQ
ncbi:MAG: M23 family metallopeptidase [Geminicoccaceae bacterium]|nr:M23 family metallopeptidase [Geminicoccaceae bacterium]